MGGVIAGVSPTLLNEHQRPLPLCRLHSMRSKSISKESFFSKILKLTLQREEERERIGIDLTPPSGQCTQTCVYPHRETRPVGLSMYTSQRGNDPVQLEWPLEIAGALSVKGVVLAHWLQLQRQPRATRCLSNYMSSKGAGGWKFSKRPRR